MGNRIQRSTALGAMRRELDHMVSKVQDEKEHLAFKKEMDGYYTLFSRFLDQKARRLDWTKVQSIGPEKLLAYSVIKESCQSAMDHSRESTRQNLARLAVLKLNGGLGTTMGCVGAKTAIEVRDGLSFMDLTIQQLEWLNQIHDVDVPLVLMNSFNTDSETRRMIQKYSDHRIKIRTFNQSRYPRISKDSLLPVPNSMEDDLSCWYPPGHGDLLSALENSGVLDELLADGREYLFVSNGDNLGATVDTAILEYMIQNDINCLMEVTDKTKADIKGGTLIEYEGRVQLLEVAQVPSEHVKDFANLKKFKVFNTNNIWVNLRALKRELESETLALDVIVNTKTLAETDQKVLQLETAAGAMIKYFSSSIGVNVPRSRFLPVKSTSDLFLVQSDLYSLEHGKLTINPKRVFNTIPLIKLGDKFQKVQEYLSRVADPPHILELDHLTVSGDVSFGSNVTLKGTVIIVPNHGSHIDIPSGSVLHDNVVSGNLHILDH